MISGFSGIGTGISGAVIKSLSSNDYSISLTYVTGSSLLSGGFLYSGLSSGRLFFANISSTVTPNYSISGNLSGTKVGVRDTLIWASSNTGVALVNQNGYAYYTGNGSSFITATSNQYPVSAGINLSFVPSSGGTTQSFGYWSPNTLLSYILNNSVDSLIAAVSVSASTARNVMSSFNDSTHVYTRNTSVWTGAVDLSGISYWNSASGGYKFNGALITPTDLACANHVLPPIGTKYAFVDNSNNTYFFTITKPGSVTASGSVTGGVNGTDINVAHGTWTNSSGVAISPPSSITYYPILPSNYSTYCPDHIFNYFPVVGMNQERQMYVCDWGSANSASSTAAGIYSGGFSSQATLISTRIPFASQGVPGYQPPFWSGDSGGGVFVLIGTQLVLIGCTTFGGGGPSSNGSWADNATAINSALTAVGSSYQLTTVNLSSYSTF